MDLKLSVFDIGFGRNSYSLRKRKGTSMLPLYYSPALWIRRVGKDNEDKIKGSEARI